jgi:hypothetical protein
MCTLDKNQHTCCQERQLQRLETGYQQRQTFSPLQELTTVSFYYATSYKMPRQKVHLVLTQQQNH